MEGQDWPSRDHPCPHCGLTGEPMVDWCGYAGRLEALVGELLACSRVPFGHLEDVLERLDVMPAARPRLAVRSVVGVPA
jgi:hypothetical protein